MFEWRRRRRDVEGLRFLLADYRLKPHPKSHSNWAGVLLFVSKSSVPPIYNINSRQNLYYYSLISETGLRFKEGIGLNLKEAIDSFRARKQIFVSHSNAIQNVHLQETESQTLCGREAAKYNPY